MSAVSLFLQMGQDAGGAIHGFSLKERTFRFMGNEAGAVEIPGKGAAGSSGGSFLINIVKRRKISAVSRYIRSLPIKGKGVDPGDLVFL